MYGRAGGRELVPASCGEVESGGTVGSGPVSDRRVDQDLKSILASDFSTKERLNRRVCRMFLPVAICGSNPHEGCRPFRIPVRLL